MTKIKLSALFLSLSLLGFGALQSEAKPQNEQYASARPSADAEGGKSCDGKHADRKAKHQARKAERLKKFDLDKDGTLNDSEKLAMKKQHFAKMDLNSDGSITMAEAKSAKAKMHAERRAANGTTDSAPKHKRGDKGQRAKKHFERADANNDGVITWEEFSVKRERKGKRGNRGPRRG